MALRKNTNTEAAAKPAFEDIDGDTTVVEQDSAAEAAATSAKPAAEAAPAAQEAKTTAVVPAAAKSLAKAQKLETVLVDLENAIPKLDFGVIPRLVATQGSFQDADGKSLGDEVNFTLVSFNNQFIVSPGDDSEAAKEFVAYSTDGKVIDETGELVTDYVRKLKEDEGYEDAACKHYVELVGILNGSAKDSEYEGQLVMISLSPQSRKQFEGYRLQRSVQIRMGRIDAESHGSENLKLNAESKKMGSNTFTLVKFKAAE